MPHQRNEAWVWEHLALTRARVIAGSDTLGHDVEALRCALMGQRPRQEVLREVAEMRARIAAAKAPDGPLDAKIGPGRMQDIELFAQASALIAGEVTRDAAAGLRAAAQVGLVPDAAPLIAAYDLQARLQMAARLLVDGTLTPDALTGGGRAFVLRETHAKTLEILLSDMNAQRAAADAIITKALEPEGAT